MNLSRVLLLIFVVQIHGKFHKSLIETIDKVLTAKIIENRGSAVNFLVTENKICKDLLENIMTKVMLRLPSTVETAEKIFDKRLRRNFSIFVLQNFEEFRETFKKITPSSFNFNGYFIIVFVDENLKDIEKVFAMFQKLEIFNVNILTLNKNGEVFVRTFNPFNTENQIKIIPISIESIHDNPETFFPKKLKNLHNFPVRVSISNTSEPETIVRILKNGSYQLDGQDIRLLRALSEALNFSLNFSYIGPIGFFLEDGNSTGPLKALKDGKADLSLNGWLLKLSRVEFFDFSTSYISDPMVFVIPPAQELTKYEKLFFPFSKHLWILLLICLAMGYLVIIVVQRCSKEVQDFVFGQNVKNPGLNLISGFLGLSQHKLPNRNFARFVLTMFFILSLVIRTAYQACFFELLQSNRMHDGVHSIHEMIGNKFKFYITVGSFDLVNGSEEIKKR